MPLLLALLALTPAPQAGPAPCPTTASPPPEFAGMARRAPLAQGGTLVPGAAVDLALAPAAGVRYVTDPAKPGKPGSFGGVASIAITKPGTYRVALGDAAWIDLVRDGKTVASTAHDHGPACSVVRKIVDFPLNPGRYTVQIAGNAKQTIAVMIVAPR